MSSLHPTATSFNDFNLNPSLLQALDEVGYKEPSPIQAQSIPLLLEGRDLIGQAQTGTGKTAAFALPILSQIDLTERHPQVLILAPTRELAIQVSENFSRYAMHMKQFRIATIYGGQSYTIQMNQLRNAPSVIVGTPGRVIDHINRGTLDLSNITHFVLDEADEMLKMGFIDDVELIINKTPKDRQTILFSATMPAPIQKIAQKHQNNPARITIQAKTATASTIAQKYLVLKEGTKFDALVRILETEPTDGVIIFVRTKVTTLTVADQLRDLGYHTSPLNGEMEQKQREKTVEALKSGKFNIIVATDVAARGLDVSRISHVINYDMPHNIDAYIHRIGRTGRAGREGKAILFCTRGDAYKLRTLERVIKQQITLMELPSFELVRKNQMAKIKQKITDVLAGKADQIFENLIKEYCQENEISELAVASALAQIQFGNKISNFNNKVNKANKEFAPSSFQENRGFRRDEHREGRGRDEGERSSKPYGKRFRKDLDLSPYRIEVGRSHGVSPGNIVGAIANEISLDSEYIGDIKIFQDYSVVELPSQLPTKALQTLEKVWVAGSKLSISRYTGNGEQTDGAHRSEKPKRDHKKMRSRDMKDKGKRRDKSIAKQPTSFA